MAGQQLSGMALAVILEVDRIGGNRGIHHKPDNRLGAVDGIERFGGMRSNNEIDYSRSCDISPGIAFRFCGFLHLREPGRV